MDTFSPVCVRKCLLSNEGLSNALPQYSHGSMVLSLGFLTIKGVTDDFTLTGEGVPSLP